MKVFKDKKIVILDDDKTILNVYSELLKNALPETKIYTFTKLKDDFYKFVEKEDIDLFIIDIVLEGQDGVKIAKQLYKSNPDTILLVISGLKLDWPCDKCVINCGESIIDYAQKPIPNNQLIHKVKFLLKISDLNKSKTKEVRRRSELIWEIFDYANLYVLALDNKRKIILCNNTLANILGYENDKELIGKNWFDFIPEKMRPIVSHVQHEVAESGNLNYQEFVNDILTKDEKLITVRWFNTKLNHDLKGTFSIGIPLNRPFKPDEDIANVRSYFKNILERDRTAITAMREMIKKG